jgi:hypothetical protein
VGLVRMPFSDSFLFQINRISTGLPKRLKKKIDLYSVGVNIKIKQSEYALKKIQELISIVSENSSSTAPVLYPFTNRPEEVICFYVDGFFAFTYSSFDILAQIIIQRKRLNKKEYQVKFKNLKDLLPNKSTLFSRVENMRFFKQLEAYRHCSIHRRHIFYESITVQTPAGYTARSSGYDLVLCDDPSSFNPRTSQKRSVIPYCQKILDKTKKMLLFILNNF